MFSTNFKLSNFLEQRWSFVLLHWQSMELGSLHQSCTIFNVLIIDVFLHRLLCYQESEICYRLLLSTYWIFQKIGWSVVCPTKIFCFISSHNYLPKNNGKESNNRKYMPQNLILWTNNIGCNSLFGRLEKARWKQQMTKKKKKWQKCVTGSRMFLTGLVFILECFNVLSCLICCFINYLDVFIT
jgi:hypothetical protein